MFDCAHIIKMKPNMQPNVIYMRHMCNTRGVTLTHTHTARHIQLSQKNHVR